MIRFHHVLQKDPGTCLAACCAMLTGCEVENVIEEEELILHGECGLKYLPLNRAIRFLLGRMIGYGFVVGEVDGVTAETDEIQVPVVIPLTTWGLLTVKSESLKGFHHAVVWNPNNRKVYDPLYNAPRDVSGYEIVEWAPLYEIKNGDMELIT